MSSRADMVIIVPIDSLWRMQGKPHLLLDPRNGIMFC